MEHLAFTVIESNKLLTSGQSYMLTNLKCFREPDVANGIESDVSQFKIVKG